MVFIVLHISDCFIQWSALLSFADYDHFFCDWNFHVVPSLPPTLVRLWSTWSHGYVRAHPHTDSFTATGDWTLNLWRVNHTPYLYAITPQNEDKTEFIGHLHPGWGVHLKPSLSRPPSQTKSASDQNDLDRKGPWSDSSALESISNYTELRSKWSDQNSMH